MISNDAYSMWQNGRMISISYKCKKWYRKEFEGYWYRRKTEWRNQEFSKKNKDKEKEVLSFPGLSFNIGFL